MTRTERAWEVLGGVLDPEVPALSVCDLGIVRDVIDHGGELDRRDAERDQVIRGRRADPHDDPTIHINAETGEVEKFLEESAREHRKGKERQRGHLW